MHPDLDSSIVRSFLEQPLLAKLVTLNKDGSPQITFMWYEFDSSGVFLFSTTKQRLKAKNLTRDSRIVERKKYGQPGARKKFQFSKR